MNKNLQDLVDQYALYGMNHKEIKYHLITLHSVPPSTHIPPISSRVSKARENLASTGKMPGWSSGVILDVKSPSNPSDADELKIINILKNATITDHSKTEEEIQSLDNVYQKNHPTSIDRWLYTLIKEWDEEGYDELRANFEVVENGRRSRLTNFQLIEAYLKKAHEKLNIGTVTELYLDSQIPEVPVDVFFSSWFVGKNTMNMQITSEVAFEALISEVAHKKNYWMNIAKQQPVYIDIKNENHGERYISGIASVPLSNGSIRYLAMIEWKDIDLQGIIQWEDDDLSEDAFLVTMHSDSIYDEKISSQEYSEAAAISHRIYKSVLNMKELNAIVLKDVLPKKDRSSKHSKKKQTKVRKESIFRFEVCDLNTSLKSVVIKESNYTWKLDHIVGVRGHFRNQPYGEGMIKRKVIWISPYTKGVGDINSKLDKQLIAILEER
jgi:hypothetical protein